MTPSIRRMSRTALLCIVIIAALCVVSASAAAKAVPSRYRAPTSDDRDAQGLVPHGRLPPKPSQEGALKQMSVPQLRRFLKDRNAACDGCVEKSDLLTRARDVQGWMTSDERVEAQLTPLTTSAATHLTLQHISSEKLPNDQVAFITYPVPVGDVINGDVLCNPALINGTQYCHSLSSIQENARKSLAM